MEININEEKNYVKSELNKPLSLSQTWYTIEVNWWQKWKDFVNFNDIDNYVIKSQPPGSIDNQDLLEGDIFNVNALQTFDYEIIPESVWLLLKKHYGINQYDDSVFKRRVIERNGQLIVETELLKVSLRVYGETDENSNKYERFFSSMDTINELDEIAVKEFNIPKGAQYFLLKELEDKSLQEIHISNNNKMTLSELLFTKKQIVYIDVKNSSGEFAHQVQNNKNYSSGGSVKGGSRTTYYEEGETSGSNKWDEEVSNMDVSSTVYSQNEVSPKGVCGLANLGNTCFMNSAIQCISNVDQITEYFLSEKWQNDLNKDNPLGMNGRIATAYATLITEMWSSKCSYAIPRDFKYEVAQFAPQFNGYSQHDSQELMMFLLDGLHEDLNRVTNKPYIEQKNCTNQPDQIVADSNWEYHLKRNDSIIVDNFHGQLKSKVVCPDCKFVSLTFDPFACLSLPLSQSQLVTVIWVPWNPTLSLHNITIQHLYKNTTIEYLKKLVIDSDLIEHKFTQILAVHIHKCQIVRILDDDNQISSVPLDAKIVFYELPVPIKDHFIMDINFKSAETGNFTSLPLFIQVHRQLNWSNLLSALSNQMPRFSNCNTINTTNKECDTDSGVVLLPSNGDCCDESQPTTTDTLSTSSSCSSSSSSSSSSSQSIKSPSFTTNNPYDAIFSINLVEHTSSSTNEHAINMLSRTRYLKGDKEHLVLEWSSDEHASKFGVPYDSYNKMSSTRIEHHHQLTVEDCLKQFLSEERLSNEDLWFCPRCKLEKPALKKLDIWRLPKVLVIHLKRFRASMSLFSDKINTEVQFPTKDLDLSKYVLNPENTKFGEYRYDLVAVSNHVGCLAGGHYFCFAKNSSNNKWYKFDDSTTSEISEDDIVTKSAYVLVYVCKEESRSRNLTKILNEDLNLMEIDIDNPE